MNKEIIANTMIPGESYHPGEYIKDEISARGMSQQKLANELKISKSEISLLINGKRNITPGIAIKLENTLDISAEFWMNLQIKYDIDNLKRKYRQVVQKSHISPERKKEMGDLITTI